ncbi:MAG: DotG/IcmE/VirB10 family protein, partial [Caulobacteraceae bacterium]|nr:DotG/IcmE/VirB10 family protein [Caulobacter sp.]
LQYPPPASAPAPAAQTPMPQQYGPPPVAQAEAPQLTPQQVYMQDQAAVSRINAQIDAILQQQRGGFAVTYYAKPPLPQYVQKRLEENVDPIEKQIKDLKEQRELAALQDEDPNYVKRDKYGTAEKFVIARPGDIVYATLDRAFNSDDPQAPLFATIHDVDESGIQGPLDGVRMVGNLKFSKTQGAIQFDKGYLPDGRTINVKGVAIDERTARTGVALNVDNHDIEKYAGLLIATLGQGVGQVGQLLTENNQQAQYNPVTGTFSASQQFNPYYAAAGALLPAGQALTGVVAQQFQRPPTITAPAGYGLGIYFVEPVAVPRDVLFATRR